MAAFKAISRTSSRSSSHHESRVSWSASLVANLPRYFTERALTIPARRILVAGLKTFSVIN